MAVYTGEAWEMNDELRQMLERHNIDPLTVIDAHTEVKFSYMWKSPLAWPLGGTYEADNPRELGATMVARRVTTKLTVEVAGVHRGGRVLMTSGEQPRSIVEVVDEGDWVFNTPAEGTTPV